MKEYKIVCDVKHIRANGNEIIHNGALPYGTHGVISPSRILHSQEDAEAYMNQVVEWGKEFLRNEEKMREHYPKLIDHHEFSNYRILSREVTEWS